MYTVTEIYMKYPTVYATIPSLSNPVVGLVLVSRLVSIKLRNIILVYKKKNGEYDFIFSLQFLSKESVFQTVTYMKITVS